MKSEQDNIGLGQFELHCLMAIGRLGSTAYGASIHELLEKELRRPIPRTQVYVCLARLEEKGLVTSSMGAPLPVRGGRSRKLFTLDGAGRQAVRDSMRTLKSLSEGWLRPVWSV